MSPSYIEQSVRNESCNVSAPSKYFSVRSFLLCYTDVVFEEVGLTENIQSYRLLPAQLTPSNSNSRAKAICVRPPNRCA